MRLDEKKTDWTVTIPMELYQKLQFIARRSDRTTGEQICDLIKEACQESMANDPIQKELDCFCANVARIRQQCQLTKQEMAQLMGVSVQTVNSLENGKLPPIFGANNLLRLCRYIKTPPSHLFCLELHNETV